MPEKEGQISRKEKNKSEISEEQIGRSSFAKHDEISLIETNIFTSPEQYS
jgi:hypothetical protein